MNNPRPQGQGLDNTILLRALAYARRRWPVSCCGEAEHELLLDDLEHDARNDPDIAALVDRARALVDGPPAEVPWWAR